VLIKYINNPKKQQIVKWRSKFRLLGLILATIVAIIIITIAIIVILTTIIAITATIITMVAINELKLVINITIIAKISEFLTLKY
jgi:hypothetical protein